ncbi:MAG TPA: N-acetyltransferase [Phenylobacterium sp.]|nr:N-acetyltransferase [Phenylobacterium sp.]
MAAGIVIRPLSLADVSALVALHRATAAAGGGLARTPAEIDAGYVAGFVARTSSGGVALGAWSDGVLVGEIHAGRMGIAQFAHVLTDLTVAVHPDWQGRGVGSGLFRALFAAAGDLTPKVERIELMAREGNADAIRLYERLGFRIEGRFAGRVRMPDGSTEADIAMGLLVAP